MLATFTSNLCEFPGLFSFNFETKKVWDLNSDRQGDRHQKVAPKQFYWKSPVFKINPKSQQIIGIT